MSAVFATYEDISDCWPIFRHNIEGFFPLRNVHKPRIAGTEINTLLRTIPVLNLKFIPLKAEVLSSKSLLNRNERPYLHIFIGFCEDIDVYRQHFRPKLKNWLEAASIRKNHQYIVILLENNQRSIHDLNKTGNSFLLDKIRFDFSDKVTLKLMSLKLMPGEILNSIPECIDLIADCIYHSILMNLNQLEEDIKKLSDQRNLSGWNYCNFFLTKESKALSLSDIGLFSEALACYDELDTLFMELHSAKSIVDTSFSFDFDFLLPENSVISGSDLSSSNWTLYRDLIHQNQISLYELQVYIFSRQIYILLETKNFSNIIRRCKEFVCRTLFGDALDKEVRNRWIFQVIFFTLKLIDADLTHIDLNPELANSLVDFLILADSQISVVSYQENIVPDQLLNISQIIDLSDTISPENYSHFKVSLLRYCLAILKNSSTTYKLVLYIKLSKLYYNSKLYNVALEILQDSSEQIHILHWPIIQLHHLELCCKCYWGLKMPREYLRKLFEIVKIHGFDHFINSSESERIGEATDLLDDVLPLEFEKVFTISELSTKFYPDGFVLIHVELNSVINLPFANCEICLCFSGEKHDFVCDIVNLRKSSEKFFIGDLPFNNNFPVGIHKLKSIRLKFGKLEFASENGSSLWGKDINLLSQERLHVEAIIPEEFDFNNPVIAFRCYNGLDEVISSLSLKVYSSEIDINSQKSSFIRDGTDIETDKFIDPNSRIDIKCPITKYSHGLKNIKVLVFFVHKEERKTSHQWVEVHLPKAWESERISFSYFPLFIDCIKVKPYFNQDEKTIELKGISIDSEKLNNELKFEIGNNGEVHLVKKHRDHALNICISYANSIHESKKSISFKTEKSNFNVLYCKIIPQFNLEQIKIGSFLKFEVRLSGNFPIIDIPYSMVYDHTKWLLSGSYNGYSKGKWYFYAVPIRTGLLQFPSLVFMTSFSVHFFNTGASAIITV